MADEKFTTPPETPATSAPRAPVVHYVNEKIHLQPSLYVKGGLDAMRFLIEALGRKRRRRSCQDPIRAVIDKKWGPDWPPSTLPTPEADRMLAVELQQQEPPIKASPDSRKRAMGRRD